MAGKLTHHVDESWQATRELGREVVICNMFTFFEAEASAELRLSGPVMLFFCIWF